MFMPFFFKTREYKPLPPSPVATYPSDSERTGRTLARTSNPTNNATVKQKKKKQNGASRIACTPQPGLRGLTNPMLNPYAYACTALLLDAAAVRDVQAERARSVSPPRVVRVRDFSRSKRGAAPVTEKDDIDRESSRRDASERSRSASRNDGPRNAQIDPAVLTAAVRSSLRLPIVPEAASTPTPTTAADPRTVRLVSVPLSALHLHEERAHAQSRSRLRRVSRLHPRDLPNPTPVYASDPDTDSESDKPLPAPPPPSPAGSLGLRTGDRIGDRVNRPAPPALKNTGFRLTKCKGPDGFGSLVGVSAAIMTGEVAASTASAVVAMEKGERRERDMDRKRREVNMGRAKVTQCDGCSGPGTCTSSARW